MPFPLLFFTLDRSASLLLSSFFCSDRFASLNFCRLMMSDFTTGNLWKGLMACGCAVTSFLSSFKIFFCQPFINVRLCTNVVIQRGKSIIYASTDRDGWTTVLIIRLAYLQVMRFGDLPIWATELSRLIQKAVFFGEIIPVDGLKLDCEEQQMEDFTEYFLWREPLFDQLIANVYQPGEGICAHVDLMRFEDGIAVVSMESERVMHFSRADQETHSHKAQGDQDGSEVKIPVLLNPGSLLLMFGEARYSWKHEINGKAGFQTWKGREIIQKKRTSVTLRKLCHYAEDG